MQKITIKNNGPIKQFEMEVKKFNLLIGEQATGKSTVAKSVYYFKTIKTKITDYLTQLYDSNSYNHIPQENIWFDYAVKPELKNLFRRLFGYRWDRNPEFYMKYEYSEQLWIQVEYKKEEEDGTHISVTYSEELWKSLRSLQQEVRELYENKKNAVQASLALSNEERKRNQERIIRRVNTIFCDDQEIYYIPAGRSILTVMSDSRAVMNQAGNLDLVTEMFMVLIDSVRSSFQEGVRNAHLFYPIEKRPLLVKDIADLIIAMEKGEYFYSGGQEFFRIEEAGEKYPVAINAASSGQQELVWLLNFMYVLLLRQENVFLIIEEPEAHIYPLLQKKVMEFIALFSNAQDSNILITTHSPYILTVINNLYYAEVLAKEGQAKEVYRLLEEKYVIPKGELSAYKLLETGYKKLLEEEGREITSSLIDEVSSQVNELYTALYDIELDRE